MLFLKERNYLIYKTNVTFSNKKVKVEKTLKVKRGVLFIGRLIFIKYIIGLLLLFIYCLLFYLTF